jgi:phosphomannomutase
MDIYKSFGEYKIIDSSSLDGYKYELGEDRFITIRASGTYPIIRLYAEAKSREEVISILNSVVNTLNVT